MPGPTREATQHTSHVTHLTEGGGRAPWLVGPRPGWGAVPPWPRGGVGGGGGVSQEAEGGLGQNDRPKKTIQTKYSYQQDDRCHQWPCVCVACVHSCYCVLLCEIVFECVCACLQVSMHVF